jgi:cytochrome c
MYYARYLAAVTAVTAMVAAGSAFAAGDPAAGEKVFKAHLCFACHKFGAGQNGVGPSLHGVFGRKAGQAPGYEYSEGVKNSGIVWTPENLEKWVQGPQAMVKDAKMMLAKPVTDPTDRQNLIAYIQQESTK